MTKKLLLCVAVLVAIALALLSLRQARIVQVNRMNLAWQMLQQERVQWQRLRLQLAAEARPATVHPEVGDSWSAALDQTSGRTVGPPAP
jgi:hypothetical protein